MLLALIDASQSEGDSHQALEYAAILIADHQFCLLPYAREFASAWLTEAEQQKEHAHVQSIQEMLGKSPPRRNMMHRIETCAICGADVDTAVEPYMEDFDGAFVCEDCADKHFNGPDHFPPKQGPNPK